MFWKKWSYWSKGGVIGLLTPLLICFFITILNNLNVAFGEVPFAGWLVVGMAFLEVPIIIIGRVLRLPVETGNTAFIMFDLTIFGEIFVFFFWLCVGTLIGWVIGKRKSK